MDGSINPDLSIRTRLGKKVYGPNIYNKQGAPIGLPLALNTF